MVHTCIAVVLLSLIGAIFSGPSCASDKPQPGNRYKIVGPLYLTGVYKDLNDRRQPSFADLSPVQSSGPEVAFLQKVALGTIITIVSPAPKRLPLFFFEDRYFIRLEPTDLPSGLDVILSLYRGNEGNLDGLNPALFSRP